MTNLRLDRRWGPFSYSHFFVWNDWGIGISLMIARKARFIDLGIQLGPFFADARLNFQPEKSYEAEDDEGLTVPELLELFSRESQIPDGPPTLNPLTYRGFDVGVTIPREPDE